MENNDQKPEAKIIELENFEEVNCIDDKILKRNSTIDSTEKSEKVLKETLESIDETRKYWEKKEKFYEGFLRFETKNIAENCVKESLVVIFQQQKKAIDELTEALTEIIAQKINEIPERVSIYLNLKDLLENNKKTFDEISFLKKEVKCLKDCNFELRPKTSSHSDQSTLISENECDSSSIANNEDLFNEDPFVSDSTKLFPPLASSSVTPKKNRSVSIPSASTPVGMIRYRRTDLALLALEDTREDINNVRTRLSKLESKVNKIEENAIGNKRMQSEYVDFKKISPFKELVNYEKEPLPGEEESRSLNLTGEILQKFFSKLAINNYHHRREYKSYEFTERVVKTEISLREWLENDIYLGNQEKKDSSTRKNYNNNFFPNDLEKSFSKLGKKETKKVFLGTGAGKSTFFIRCVAFHNKKDGVTVVVPNRSLIGSFVSSHNNWLSKGKDLIRDDEGNLVDDQEKRVTICPICDENHAREPYKVVHNNQAELINIFTWDELVKTLVLKEKKKAIKKIVVFDEAHTSDIWYRKTIELLKNQNFYRIIELSATFPDLPSSSFLRGTISDNYVHPGLVSQFCQSKKDFLSKKIIVFCSEPDLLDRDLLSKNKIGCLTLNDQLMDYATDIVHSTNSRIIIADSSYSLGFTFGDVNVISTGISSRKSIEKVEIPGGNYEFKIKKEKKQSEFSDLIQERGRCARERNHSGIWVSFVPPNKKVKSFLDSTSSINEAKSFFDLIEKKVKSGGVSSLSELAGENNNSAPEKILEVFGSYQFKKSELTNEDKKKSFIYFRDIFFKTLCDKFMKETFFGNNILNEKGLAEPQFIFENDFISVFVKDKDFLIKKQDRIARYKSILKASTWEIMKNSFEVEYEWAKRTEFSHSDSDRQNCFKFFGQKDVEKASFILSLRDENSFDIIESFDKKSLLKIVVKSEVVNANKLIALKSFNESKKISLKS